MPKGATTRATAESQPAAAAGKSVKVRAGATRSRGSLRVALREALDECAKGISNDSVGTDAEVYEEVSALVLLAIGAATTAEGPKGGPGQFQWRVNPQAEVWCRRLRTATPRLWIEFSHWIAQENFPEVVSRLRIDPRVVLERLQLPNAALASLMVTARRVVTGLSQSPEALVCQLGVVYEILLTLRFHRLQHLSVRLGPAGGWVPVSELAHGKHLANRPALLKRLLANPQTVRRLSTATSPLEIGEYGAEVLPAATEVATVGQLVVDNSTNRRRTGAHYTSWPLCTALVRRCLEPLVSRLPLPRSQAILRLRICDPAMGVGVFIIASTLFLSEQLHRSWQQEGHPLAKGDGELGPAIEAVARQVIHGVDIDPQAVALACMSLSHLCARYAVRPASDAPPWNLESGNSLTGMVAPLRQASTQRQAANQSVSLEGGLDWSARFPAVFLAKQPGFDAVVGNPPWISFVGRAAQPPSSSDALFFRRGFLSFSRYKTLHGLFVERCAHLLRTNGRLGLLLPTSVADLDGYAPTRRAHDLLCQVDPLLPDWSEGAFEEVFQPTMALTSTRMPPRAAASHCTECVWPLQGSLATPQEISLQARLSALPKCPPELFGERGYQTHPSDRAAILRASDPSGPYQLALYQGADVVEYQTLAPRMYAEEAQLTGRLRPRHQWQNVALWIRQTTRFPVAAFSRGGAFRNSILAGFEHADYPAGLLLAYLNSTLIRWLHFNTHRDARQGMPQLKIGHLRSLPAFPSDAPDRQQLAEWGQSWGRRNSGVSQEEKSKADDIVFAAFSLSEPERLAVQQWQQSVHLPRSRRLSNSQTLG